MIACQLVFLLEKPFSHSIANRVGFKKT